MQITYDKSAPRRSVNLTANSDLVNMVRREKGNLSELLEKSMIAFIDERELARWKEENRVAFDSYNRMIAERGPISEEVGLLL